jgi:hypothetical protein
LLRRCVLLISAETAEAQGTKDNGKPFAPELKATDLEDALLKRKQDQYAVFTSVGQALSIWARMEEMLVAIAGLLLDTRFTKAGAVLYSIINFNVWLSLIDELFVLEPNYNAHKPRWNKISERLRGLKDTRDRLAHHTAYFRDIGGTALRPGRLDTRRKSLKYQPLDFEQISTFIISVSDALQDLAELLNAMTGVLNAMTGRREPKPWPEKSSEPSSDPHPP